MLPWQHLLPGIIEKLISTNPCSGLECKEHPERLLSPRNKKVLPCQHLLPGVPKTNQLQSVQGYGKQRTHKIFIFISPRNRKQAISAREWALCQTVCFEFQSRNDRRKGHKSCALEMVFRRKLRR